MYGISLRSNTIARIHITPLDIAHMMLDRALWGVENTVEAFIDAILSGSDNGYQQAARLITGETSYVAVSYDVDIMYELCVKKDFLLDEIACNIVIELVSAALEAGLYDKVEPLIDAVVTHGL